MSKKTSPQSRPARKLRSRGPSSARAASGSRVTGRGGPAQRPPRSGASAPGAKEAAARPTTFAGRLRRFAPVVGVPEMVIVLVILVLALGGLMLSATPLAYFPLTVGEMWLVTTLVPVVIEGVSVSFLPMLPAIGLIALLAYRIRRAIRTRVSMIDLAVLLLCVLVIPLLITGTAWLMVWDAAKVYQVEAPPLGETLLRTVIVHLTALVIGMGQRLWRAVARHYSVPPALVDGVRESWRFFARLAVVALLLLVVLLAVGWSSQVELLAEFPNLSTSGLVALIALSIGYLPNAIIAAGAVLMGSEFHVGEASVSLFSLHLVPLPPLPIAAAIPGEVAPWAPALLLATAGIASWVMVKARPDATHALGAAGGAALIAVTACFLGGGELGWYGATGASLGMSAALAAVWLGALGLATAGALALTALRDRKIERGAADTAAAAAAEGETERAAEPVTAEDADEEPGEDAGADEEPDEDAGADESNDGDAEESEQPEALAEGAESDAEADRTVDTEGQPVVIGSDTAGPGEEAGVDKQAEVLGQDAGDAGTGAEKGR